MIRRLLTLLALCAGLAAVAEPARASAMAMDSLRLVEQVTLACGEGGDAASFAAPQRAVPRAEGKAGVCPRPVLTIVVPTVMLKVDRALD
jgi:hypothetical protein